MLDNLGGSSLHRHSVSNSPPLVKSPPSEQVDLPRNHKYFRDCLRECNARFVSWAMGSSPGSSWFVTMTFKDYIRLGYSKAVRNRWLAHLNDAVLNLNKGSARLRWISALEWQHRDVVHFHLIVIGKGIDLLSRKSWERRWQAIDSNAGYCRIYKADKRAAPYLAKYTSKSLRGELEWGGFWQGLYAPHWADCGCSKKDFNIR